MAYTDTAPGFDSLSYAQRLKDGDVGEKQAKAHAEAVRDFVITIVATKADVARLEDKMNDLPTKVDVAQLETRMTHRFYAIAGGIVLTNAGAVIAAVWTMLP